MEAVPAEVRSAMDEFVGRKDAQAVASFVSALIDSAFQGVPAAAGSSKAPAKANVSSRTGCSLTAQHARSECFCIESHCSRAIVVSGQSGEVMSWHGFDHKAQVCTGLRVDVGVIGTHHADGEPAMMGFQVGLLAVLALALRAKPAALVLAAQHLAAGGSRFSSTGRLPLLLWVFNQCARCALPPYTRPRPQLQVSICRVA